MNVLEQVEFFYRHFRGEKSVIGKSTLGKDIYCFTVKKSDEPKIIVQYAIHAREYITAYLALKQIEDFVKRGEKGTVYFLPTVNPDGIERVINGDFFYKANADGVDLNVNFPARFGSGRQNVFVKGSENYVGEFPLSAKESRVLFNFTLDVMPSATISYHAKGEEIYWQFFQDEMRARRDFKLAKQVATSTGYALKLTPNSAGGYKDWCIESLHIPALTIEVGNDMLVHPIGVEHLQDIFDRNKEVIKVVTESDIWN